MKREKKRGLYEEKRKKDEGMRLFYLLIFILFYYVFIFFNIYLKIKHIYIY